MASASSNIVSYNSSHSYYQLTNAANGYHGSSNTSYANMNLTRGSRAESYMYWEFSLPTIPTGATIDSITCNYKARTSTTSTSYIAQATIQMCSGTTTKGTSKSILSTSTSASSFSSTEIGEWTVAELNAGVKLRTYAMRGLSRTSSNYYVRFYGADIEVAYTEAVTGNKVFIKSSGTWKEAQKIYVKVSGTWKEVSKVFKKVNGAWVQQSDNSVLFDPNAIYKKG